MYNKEISDSKNLLNYSKLKVRGKFIYCGSDKFYIKGVTYGTFAPDSQGNQFPGAAIVEADFEKMVRNGINSVRTYTVPPKYILDLALKYGLRIMVGLPWEQHIVFLDDVTIENKIVANMKTAVQACTGHPALLCYAFGNEIPAPIVRWHGHKKVEKFLKKLFKEIKSVDPITLVTYVNYPTTEYLQLPFLDFLCFNVYLESSEQMDKYLSRLHNLSADKPLVIAEIGLDSIRNGEIKQSDTLRWQLKSIFASGCSGAFVFSWTDDWWRGGHAISDWKFGIVDKDRHAKPALFTIKEFYTGSPIKFNGKYPFVSIVICSYNGSGSILDTLEAINKLEYKNYEVLLINDGSTDGLEHTVSKYSINLITTENKGLSNARNTGYLNSKGDIIAYIDDDAFPDPHWLDYLVYAFNHSNHVCIGGPNIVPIEDKWIAQCVAVSPGGPIHVLLTDDIAEHVPGCNMAFKREILEELKGFDPIFRAAGDDVDICWRIQELGYTIGYHPGALVWHHRRNSIKAYWKQQVGYGKAEALLERKWPEKYNNLGHLTWTGRIYGNNNVELLKFSKDKIFYGTWGTSLFQSVYSKPSHFWTSFFKTPEWFLLVGFLIFIYLLGFSSPLLFNVLPILIFSVGIIILQSAHSGWHSLKFIRTRYQFILYWLLITFFHIIQPIARLIGRLKNGLTPWRKRGYQINPYKSFLFQSQVQLYWSESWKSLYDWLSIIEQNIIRSGIRVQRGSTFDAWDLEVDCGFFSSARALLTIEEHGDGKQFIKFKTWINFSVIGLIFTIIHLIISISLWANGHILVAVIFSIITLYIGFRYFNDPGHAIAGLKNAFLKLNEKKQIGD